MIQYVIGAAVLGLGGYFLTKGGKAITTVPGSPPPPAEQLHAVASGNTAASPNVSIGGRLQPGFQTAPPAPVVPATVAQQADPQASAIDAKQWGITLFVWDTDLNAPNQPIVVDAIQSNQAEITLTCILVWFAADKSRAIIQWVPTADLASAPDLGDLTMHLVNGQYYWADVHKNV